jgi:hypothetical protein
MPEKAEKKIIEVMKRNGITLSCYRFGSIREISGLADYSFGYTSKNLYSLYRKGVTWVAGKSQDNPERGWYHSLNDLNMPHQEKVEALLKDDYIPPIVDKEGYVINYFNGFYDMIERLAILQHFAKGIVNRLMNSSYFC